MSGLIMIIGAISILFGAFDLLDFGEDKDNKDWKKLVIKIVGGFVVIGVGKLLSFIGM